MVAPTFPEVRMPATLPAAAAWILIGCLVAPSLASAQAKPTTAPAGRPAATPKPTAAPAGRAVSTASKTASKKEAQS